MPTTPSLTYRVSGKSVMKLIMYTRASFIQERMKTKAKIQIKSKLDSSNLK